MNDALVHSQATMESLVAQVVDEFQARQARGESPDPEEYAQRHPETAAVLREVLAALRLVGLSTNAAGQIPADVEELTGTLGDFRLLREAGRGGMGVVYEAVQLSLGRRVALKVLPFAATMDPRHLQRFHNEARAAACLHHEHIVPVYSVGCERGVHFYAMQFIEGQTLAVLIHELRKQTGLADVALPRLSDPALAAESADAESLTAPHVPAPASRPAAADTSPWAGLSTHRSDGGAGHYGNVARLGVQAALALEHAHERGIVHRDVKPGNLLLDERGSLWVADFGLAQVQQGEGNLTMTGDVLGTLRYMSPEQALARRVMIDHRTDVYSLGVTLYELLTLRPAFPGNDRQELLRQVAFEEPITPRKLDRNIPGELETIVLKAVEKNPTDRYTTALELADDLGRFLRHEPIRATQPTWIQRASKWSRRHPAIVRSAVIMLFLLTAGSLLSTWLIWKEKARTGEALAAETTERSRADEEKRNAQEREEETKAALAFVESMFTAAARQEGGLGHDEKLRRALKAGLPLVAEKYAGQPLIEARLRRTLGLSFRYLGDEKLAAEQFEAACSLYAKHRGADHPETLASMNNLANSYAALGRHADALKLREETLDRRRATLGADDRDTLNSMNNLANSYAALGRHAEALKLHEETLDRRKASLGLDHPDTLASMNNLAISYDTLGAHAEAVKLREETLALVKSTFALGHPRILAAMSNLAQSYHALGRYAESIKLYEETLALVEATLGGKNPNTMLVMNNLAWLLATAEDVRYRDPARAVELAAKAAQLSPKNPYFSSTLGIARYRSGDWKQAVVDLEKTISLRGPDDSSNANEGFFLAMSRLQQLGDKPGARQWFDRGTTWMDRTKSRTDEMRRFRVEAAELLGIKDNTKRPDH